MADLSDVENELVSLVSAALYPQGSNATSILGVECRIYRGWPLSTSLNADLTNGVINVTVFPSATPGRLLTSLPITHSASTSPSTFTVIVTNLTISFAGTPVTSQRAGLIIDGLSYSYRPQVGDSAEAVAAALAVSVRANTIVILSGANLTVPTASKIVARIASDGVCLREVRRQSRDFVIACWCPTPSLRDAVTSAVDSYLVDMPFFAIQDGTSARLIYLTTMEYDQAQNSMLYRRDITFSIEYSTIVPKHGPGMLFGDLSVNVAGYIV